MAQTTKLDKAVNQAADFNRSNAEFLKVCTLVLSMCKDARDANTVRSIRDYFITYSFISPKQKDLISFIYVKYA